MGGVSQKVNLVWQPDGIVNGNASINAFYKQCCDTDTIYFKIDDDIVWMEPDSIARLVKFRVEHPEFFLVSPLVINNAVSTYLLQVRNKISLDKYYNSMAAHPVLWKSGDFAAQLHRWFIERYLNTGKYEELHCGMQPMGMMRFSINAIMWMGGDMKKINGQVSGDDEEFLSSIYPTMIGKANCWDADVIMSHFAFFTQREKLDKEGILDQYGMLLSAEWGKDEKMKDLYEKSQKIMHDIRVHEAELALQPSPYKMPKVVAKGNALKSIKRCVRSFIPPILAEKLSDYKNKSNHIS